MTEETMTLPGVNNATIHWRGSVIPMVVSRGTPPVEWVVIGSAISCEQNKRYGNPRPDYVQFNYKNGHWTYRKVDPQFYQTISNLMVNPDRYILETHIPVEDKAKFNKRSEGIGHRYLKVSQYSASGC